ncbi:MAG: ATP-binding protein [Planctomycetota bacterium]|jgi:CO dehydrogenase maturation factor
MATTIAISGKGGSGKTTLAAMIIRSLLAQGDSGAVLAVDADPNSCLGLTCGVRPAATIAEIREESRQKQPSNTGMDRVRSFEYGIQQAISEATGFDLLTMGRPEGPNCYCAINNMLRAFLDKLSSQYQYVIIDNEAGMEHLSRRTTNNVDLLYIVAEPTALGVITTQRIFELAKQLPISVKEIGVIWNNTLSIEKRKLKIGNCQLETFGGVPYDKAVFDASMQGKTVFDLEENSPAFLSVRNILERTLNLKSVKREALNGIREDWRISDGSS